MSDEPIVVHVVDQRSDTDSQEEVDAEYLAKLMLQVLKSEDVNSAAEASLSLLDPSAIGKLKAEYLEGDGQATDVLSFPLDGPDLHATNGPEPLLLGDVFVCPQVAVAQAAEHAGSVSDELALLVIHGTLHLMGWDHADEDERDAMWQRERELMIEFHGTPARDPWRGDEP